MTQTTDQPDQPTAAPRKPFYRRAWFWLLVIAAIVIIAVASGRGGDKAVQTAPSTGAPAPQAGSSAPAAQPADDPLSDGDWTASDIRVDAQSFGTTITARVTNGQSGTRSGVFTLTVFSNGAVVATGHGAANDVEGGSTASVQFLATEDLSSVDPATLTYELQTDF
jgi:hypothetical protein